jgi:hypothetical protein
VLKSRSLILRHVLRVPHFEDWLMEELADRQALYSGSICIAAC